VKVNNKSKISIGEGAGRGDGSFVPLRGRDGKTGVYFADYDA